MTARKIICEIHGLVCTVNRGFDGDKAFESHMSDFPNVCDYRHYIVE